MTSIVKSRSLECGGLAPLWPRLSAIDNKAAPGRRTPKWRSNQIEESFSDGWELIVEDCPQIKQHLSFGDAADDRRRGVAELVLDILS